MKKIRCAIYTRKSSEEGLEQEFNSLHAQREACAAYILSQKHEGWDLLPEHYDDGGFSGGTMERPALKALLASVEQGKIDIIVVYKVDRLTRSLMDFSRLVETMDKKGISFVSITQQFNTTTSMGRLTLNVLLSFAQFEREVTGERIRDKIALSKQKGKWMGGTPPLGYEAKQQKLLVNEEDAQVVRHIFTRYSILQSVNLLKAELDADGYRTKLRLFENGKQSGGRPFMKGNLYNILQNRVYLGETVHKGTYYPGEHEGVIDPALFQQVQHIITSNRIKKLSALNSQSPSLLSGRLFDDQGHCMTPKHSRTHRRHYRYYTSQAILRGEAHKAGSLANIPAHEIEQLVRVEIIALLKDERRLQPYLHSESVEHQATLLKTAQDIEWTDSNSEWLFIKSILQRIDLSKDSVTITLCTNQLIKALRGELDGTTAKTTDHPITITRNIRLSSARKGSKVIIGSTTTQKNMQLIKAITRSFLWNEQILSGERTSIQQIGDEHSISSTTYITRILRLRFLAPDIIESILEGTQPADWTVEKLFAIKTLDWHKQRQTLCLV